MYDKKRKSRMGLQSISYAIIRCPNAYLDGNRNGFLLFALKKHFVVFMEFPIEITVNAICIVLENVCYALLLAYLVSSFFLKGMSLDRNSKLLI